MASIPSTETLADPPFRIDDLCLFEPGYLRTSFDPRAYGFDDRTLAAALSGAAPGTLAYLAEHVKPDLRPAIARAQRGDRASGDEASAVAARRLLDDYTFHLVYRKYPEAYERFSAAQEFAFEELFPSSRYVGRVVLDVGCGTGKLVGHVAPFADRVVGIDPVEAMLEIARKKYARSAHVGFRQGTFCTTGLPDRSVDMVVSNMAFPSRPET